jgi:predicted transcriptional regulator
VGETVESLTNKLTDIVSREVKQFELFLKLLIDQQNYLVANDLENLNRVIKEQERAILVTRELERNRMRVIAELSEQIDDDPNNMTLSRVTKSLAQPQALKLEKMQKALTGLHAKINKVKSKNEFLIKKSMEYIEGTVRLLASSNNEAPTYGDGNSKEQKSPSIAVNRTA